MPLVRIDAATPDDSRLAAVGDAVHAALVSTLGVPPDDVFQVLGGAGRVRYDSDYLGVHRDDGVVFVQVVLRRGRGEELKRAFYADLAARASVAGVEPRNLVVVLVENDAADWSFGEGIAQYVEGPHALPR